jgi:hypothetical protein
MKDCLVCQWNDYHKKERKIKNEFTGKSEGDNERGNVKRGRKSTNSDLM